MSFEVLCVCFVVEFCGMYRHIVHIDREPLFGDLWGENRIHHGLKGCGGIRETKEHDCWFKQAFICHERRFPFVSLFNADIVVPPSYIEFGVEGTSSKSIDELWDKRKWVFILYRPVIDRTIILDGSQFAIFLFNEEERCGVWGFGWSNGASA